MACLLHEKHIDVHNRAGIQVFTALSSIDDLRNWIQSFWCKHTAGSWLQSWLDFWLPGEGGQLSLDALADLWSMKVLWVEDTVDIECGHAAVRRDVNVLSAQAKSAQLLTVSSKHIARTVRRHARGTPVLAHGADVPDEVIRSEPDADDEAEEPKAKKAKGSWAYRMFTRERTKDSHEGCGVAGLGAEWHNLPQSERNRFADLGRAAAGANDMGLPSCGLTKRAAKRLAGSTERERERQQLLIDFAAGSAAAGSANDGGRAWATSGASNSALDTCADWDAGRRLVANQERGKNRRERAMEQIVEDTLNEYCQSGFDEDAEPLRGLLRDLVPSYHQLPESLPQDTGFTFLHHHAPMNVAADAAITQGQTKKTTKVGAKLASLLTEEFNDRHKPHIHAEVPRLFPKHTRTLECQCYKCHRVLCDDHGTCTLAMSM